MRARLNSFTLLNHSFLCQNAYQQHEVFLIFTAQSSTSHKMQESRVSFYLSDHQKYKHMRGYSLSYCKT